MSDYYAKYIKYKTKYINLKKKNKLWTAEPSINNTISIWYCFIKCNLTKK